MKWATWATASSMAVILMQASSGSASAQVPALAVMAGRHGLGIEAEASTRNFGIFSRAEGFPFSDVKALTGGIRWWPQGSARSGLYISPGAAWITCAETDISGGATGCDGDGNAALSLSAGIQLTGAGSRVVMFVDGTTWRARESAADVPKWTFAAGVKLKL